MSDEFHVVGLVGEGGFGKVFLIEQDNDPSIKQAMKIMDMNTMDEYTLKMTLQEIKLLKDLEHKHVLTYIECFQKDGKICMITEYCPNGDLGVYIEERKRESLEKNRLIEWFRQIASAIEYLHGRNIIHRDLKVQNVFLDANMDCKLGDFGIARVLDSVTDMAQTQIGTYHYMSPEMFMAIPYNVKTDIWSLAVVIYELATLEKPFDSFFLPALIFKITRGEKPDMPKVYGDDFVDLLSSMMEKNPDDRPSSADIMKHKLFKQTKKPKPMPNLKNPFDAVVAEFEAGGLDPKKFLRTFVDMKVADKVPGKKTKLPAVDEEGATKVPGKKTNLPAVDEEGATKVPGKKTNLPAVDEEGATKVPGKKRKPAAVDEDDENNPVMDLVTRTLSGMGHDTSGGGHKGARAHLKHQVDMLRLYCLQVLDNDKALFERASKELDKDDDEDEIEEMLIRVIGHEKFGMCGEQLLHYKNYSFNLRNMK